MNYERIEVMNDTFAVALSKEFKAEIQKVMLKAYGNTLTKEQADSLISDMLVGTCLNLYFSEYENETVVMDFEYKVQGIVVSCQVSVSGVA